MSHEDGGGGDDDEMALRAGHPQTVGPLEDEDLLGEILVRLPPLPSSLVRASAVSRHWGRLAADRAFLRRFRTHHRRPPVLGVFEMRGGELVFTPLLDGPDRIPRERFSLRFWHALGCWALLGYRHGRVLIVNLDLALLLVFDPVTGGLRGVVIPPDFVNREYVVANGAVLCAAGDDDQGHVHGDCHSGPFKVVLMATRRGHPVVARVYSSETGEWGDLALMAGPCIVSKVFPSTLIGNALYWWLRVPQDGILKFDLDSQTLSVVRRPIFSDIPSCCIRIIRGEHGGVGLAVFSYRSLQMWERIVNRHGTAIWVLRKTARMHSMLRYAMLTIVGYSEDGDALLLKVSFGGGAATYSFIIQLESLEWTYLNQRLLENSCHPFAYFYTTGTVRVSRTAPAIEPSQQRSTISAIVPPQQ